MRTVKGVGVFLSVILLWGVAHLCVADGKAAAKEKKPLVIGFDSGISGLGESGRTRIRDYLGAYGLTPKDKILVVGHTDNSGASKENIRLSYQRAQTVRKEIIKGLGMDGRHVIAIGRGEALPVGDNKTPAGRALNRRVEIYLAQMVTEPLTGGSRRIAPDLAAVLPLVEDAKGKLRRQDITGALKALNAARAQGGEEVASWHAAYAVVGFYAGADAPVIKRHLQKALTLDPFDEDAREFMGRVTAQENVAAGAVTREMGRDGAHPIAIRFDSQAREYLRLFGMQVLSHRPAKQRGLEIWRCKDATGEPVTYYFDRSGTFGWAFAVGAEGAG